MNIFRLIGDVSHQVAIILLILQLKQAKNARGKFYLASLWIFFRFVMTMATQRLTG